MSIRKLLLTSLFFISVWALGLAQNSVTFHGTVVDADDVPQENITVLASAYFADSTVIFLTLTTDGDGQYGEEFFAPGPDIHGWLEISMVDCWGTTITQNFEIFTGNEDFTADFLYCEDFIMDSCLVIILEEWNQENELELVAWNPLGQEATYLWNTGDSTQSIFPQGSGTYCVTATFPWGCAWTDCIDVDLDSMDNCFAYIGITQENDTTWTLEAYHSGGEPIEYVWSTGETTKVISNVGPGTYCVSAFDAEGCADTTCVILDEFSFCEVYIWENPNGLLIAEGLGEPPTEYLWSTGENTQSIYPVENGLYCVTATDVNGCAAESCYKYFQTQDSCYAYIVPIAMDSSTFGLEARSYPEADSVTYEWSTGETTSIITDIDPLVTYCVTITDVDGCAASACFDFSYYCYSWVDVNYLDTTTAVLTVGLDSLFQIPGAPQPTYLWSNGETGQEITVGESGEYCVTVSIGNCINESCNSVDFDSLGTYCDVWAYSYVDSSGNWVATAYAWGFGDFEYLWTNGDTTQTIDLDFPQEYACVTITSSFGCEAVACVDSIQNICGGYVHVNYQNDIAILTANMWSLEPGIELLWSTGDTTETIEVSESGSYCVTITTAFCSYTACAEVFFWVQDSCGVWLSAESHPGAVEYTANPWGEAPFAYLWSNGETNQSVFIDLGDPDLCVTVTDATGCMATACTFILDSCNIVMNYTEEPVPTLYVTSSDPISHVEWSTGDTTNYIEITEAGTYCADVTTVFGCSVNVCYTVDSLPGGLQNFFEGIVFGDSITQAEGWVTIYAFDPNSGEPFTKVDSVEISPTGYYVTSILPDGIYIAQAVLTPGSPDADDFLPSYHFTGTTWQEATTISLPAYPLQRHINMVPIDEGFQGVGVIAGLVTDDENIIGGEDEAVRGSGEGLSGVEVILKNAQGLPLNYTWSIENGAYRFENLPYGTYRLSYEIAGLFSPEIWVTLTPKNPTRLDVNLEVEGGTVAVKDLVTTELSLYPNPAKLEITIPMAGGNAQYDMQLVDMQGKIVNAGSVSNVNGVITIDVRPFAPGLYHINLKRNNEFYYGRFIKQD